MLVRLLYTRDISVLFLIKGEQGRYSHATHKRSGQWWVPEGLFIVQIY